MEVSIEKEKLKESKKDEAHSDMSKKEGKPSTTAPHSTAGKLEKQYDQSLMVGIAATDSGYNGRLFHGRCCDDGVNSQMFKYCVGSIMGRQVANSRWRDVGARNE
jgi:predicted alpha/beta-fold hydrolase